MNVNIAVFLRDRCVEQVLAMNERSDKLPGLVKTTSDEGGFELPWDNYWINIDFVNHNVGKHHSSRQLQFVYEDDMIVGLKLRDNCNYWSSEELFILKELITEALNTLEAREFVINCNHICQKYGTIEEDISEMTDPKFFEEVAVLIPHDAIIGDVIQSIPDKERYRNSGTMIITEDDLKPLYGNADEYGSVHPTLLVDDGSFNPQYWMSTIAHNSIIFLSDTIKKQIVNNNCENFSTCKINGKEIVFIANNEDDEVIDIDSEVIDRLMKKDQYFEYTDDSAFNGDIDSDEFYILLRM